MSTKYLNAQDEHIQNLLKHDITTFEDHFHKKFNENDYVCEYTKLDYTSNGKNRGVIVLLNTCDIVSDIDIVIPTIYNKNFIRWIDFEINGSQIDKVYFNGITENIIYNLMQKKVINIENKHVIPIPFFMNMIPLLKLKKSEIRFWIETNDEYADIFNNIELYGKKYTLKSDNMRQLLINEEKKEYMIIQIQTQFTGEDYINKGINKYKLPYNHPVFLIHFDGINKTNIKNITLTFDDEIIRSGKDEFDDVKKIFGENNYDNIDSNIIIFDNTFNKNNLYSNHTNNFSTIDCARLIIDIDEVHADSVISITAMNYNTIYFASGTMALTYSK